MRPRPRRLGRLIFALGTLGLVAPAPARVSEQLAGLRVPFATNQGRVDARVVHYAQTFAGTLFVTRRGELVYALAGGRAETAGLTRSFNFPVAAGAAQTVLAGISDAFVARLPRTLTSLRRPRISEAAAARKHRRNRWMRSHAMAVKR